jgi:tetratricopeptide (TPR) repeat protein
MKRIIILLVFLAFSNGTACLWDRDTIRDEIASKSSAYDLIVGQVAHHGSAYYEKRVEALNQKEMLGMSEKQDLAVAYIRLGRFVHGHKILMKLYDSYPDDYAVNSNLAILHKKIGEYDKADAFMKRALEIKPEGHMGLGDWYWRRIDYSERLDEKPTPELNFLGEKYTDTNLSYLNRNEFDAKRKERARYLTQLIFNDRDFADGYLVLGDLLWETGDINLALRAYIRAKLLGHPNDEQVINRIDAVIHHQRGTLFMKGKILDGIKKFRDAEIVRFKKEMAKAEEWRGAFEKTESEWVTLKYFPSLSETESKMKAQRFYPKEKSD